MSTRPLPTHNIQQVVSHHDITLDCLMSFKGYPLFSQSRTGVIIPGTFQKIQFSNNYAFNRVIKYIYC